MPSPRRFLSRVLFALALAGAACPLTAAPAAVRDAGEGAGTPLVDEQVRAAVAAVLVATLASEFGDAMLELRLGEATVAAEGARDHVVSGLGEVRFAGGGEQWMAFAYRTRYDPLAGGAGWPEIRLGTDGAAEGERYVPNDARLVGELESAVAGELEALPGAGRVWLQLDRVASLESGGRFLRIDAAGVADFGPGGRTGVEVEGLFDAATGRWLRIAHALEPNVRAHDAATAAQR